MSSKWCGDEYQFNKKLFALLIDDIPLERLPAGQMHPWVMVSLNGLRESGTADRAMRFQALFGGLSHSIGMRLKSGQAFAEHDKSFGSDRGDVVLDHDLGKASAVTQSAGRSS